MYFKNIQELLNLKNNGILPYEDAEWNGVYGLNISIDFKLQTLNDEEFQEVCNFIEQYSNLLREIYVREINVSILGDMNRLQKLCNAISKCKLLESIDLYGLIIEKMYSRYLQEINHIFLECRNLRLLNLSWFPFNKLKMKDLQDLCEIISGFTNLQKLNLFSIGFDKLKLPHCKLLCNTIKSCPKLQSITLDQTELDHMETKCILVLFTTISESKTIIYCNLEGVQPEYNKERWHKVKEILKTKQILLETNEAENILLGFQKQKIKRSRDLLSYNYGADNRGDSYLPKTEEKGCQRKKKYNRLHY